MEKNKKLLGLTPSQVQVLSNSFWLYALQFFNTIIPLITLPYITRILGATQYGAFSIVLNLQAYLQVVVEYGFGYSATRKVALTDSDNGLNKMFTEVVCSRLLLFSGSALFSLVYISLAHLTASQKICLIILVGSLLGYCFQENWLFQGKQDMKYISLSNVIARTCSTIGVFVFVKSESDLVLYAILYSLSPVISNMVGTAIAVKKYSLRFVSITFKEVVIALKESAYVFSTQLSSKVFSLIGITFLGLFDSDFSVGIFSALYKIPQVLMLMWTPVSQVLYPLASKRITDLYHDGYKFIMHIRKYSLFTFGAISLMIAVFAKQVAEIAFGGEYAQYYYIVYPLLLWLIFGINNNFVGIQAMLGSGHDKEYSKCFQAGVAATILFNLIFIWRLGIIGAAIAPAISEATLSLLLFLMQRRIDKQMNGE